MNRAPVPLSCSLCAGPLYPGEPACRDCGRPAHRSYDAHRTYEPSFHEELDEERVPSTRQLMGFLVSDEGARAEYWAIRLGMNDIGRSRQLAGDVCLGHETVSLCHATLTVDERGYGLTDHGSTNGTLVNGSLLPPGITVSVRDGDEMCFGDCRVFLVDVSLRLRG